MKKYVTFKRVAMLMILVFILSFKIISCDGGCDIGATLGCESTDGFRNLEWGEYPEDEKIYNLAMLRIGREGFNFLSDNTVPLIEAAMGGPLAFPIAETDLLTCTMCPGGCNLELEIEDINIKPIFPDVLEVEIILPPDFEIVLPTEGGFSCLWCNSARIHTCGAGGCVPLKIITNIFVDTDNDTGLLDLRVDSPLISYDDIHVSLCDGSGALIDMIIGFATGLIEDAVRNLLRDIVDQLKCVSCKDGAACPDHPDGYATECVNDVCRLGSATWDECLLMPLGIEAEINVGALMESFVPDLEANLWMSFLTGGYTQVIDSGLDLGIFGGTMVPPGSAEPCTGFVEYPGAGTQLPRIPINNMNEHIAPPVPFHIGIGVREELLDQMGYAINNSGLLCMALDQSTPQIGDYIGPSTFGLLIPDMNILTNGENAPWKMQLEPGPPMDFAILDHDAAYPDNPEIEASVALKIKIDDLKLHYIVLVDERMIKMFTLQLDANVLLGLDIRDDSIELVLGADAITLEDYKIPFTIAGIPPAIMAEKFDSLIGGLLGSLLGDLLKIDPIVIPGFDIDGNGTEDLFIDLQGAYPEIAKGGGEYQALYVYAGMRMTGRGGEVPFRSETNAELKGSYLPTPEEFLEPGLYPYIDLKLSGQDADGLDENLEYSVSINGGFWTMFSDKQDLRVDSNILLLQGKHEIAVRSRDKRYKSSIDETPDVFTFITDYIKPSLKLLRNKQTVEIVANDNVTRKESLQFRFKTENSEWSEWSDHDLLDLSQLGEFPINLSVQTIDEAGLMNTVSRTYKSLEIETSKVLEPAGSHANAISGSVSTFDTAEVVEGGCSATSSTSAWLLLFLLPLIAIRRKVKAFAPIALTGLMVFAMLGSYGCSSSNTGPDCVTNIDCDTGEMCDNGDCVPAINDGDIDGNIDYPDGDGEIEKPDVDGDDVDTADGEDPIVEFPCDKDGKCPSCYYCSARTNMCKWQQCDPTCTDPRMEDCPTSAGDSCSQCVSDDNKVWLCEVPRCNADNAAELCDCRECETGEVVTCIESTGLCACVPPCSSCLPVPDQACCVTDDPAGVCYDCPGWCEGVECDPGFAAGSCDPTKDDDCNWSALWSQCGNFDYTACEFIGVGMPDHAASCGCQEKASLPIGWHGRFSDMAVFENEEIWLTAYNATYGDLMIGRAKYSKLIANEISWAFVDGVPDDEEPTGGPSGYREGIIEKGDDVGKHTAIALTTDGWPRVVYQDVDNGDLVFIYTNGELAGEEPDGDVDGDVENTEVAEGETKANKADDEPDPKYKWTKLVIDQEGDTGYYSEIWLDAQNRPVIAYMMKSNDAGDVSELRLAMATSDSPTDPSDFVIVTVDSAPIGIPYCATPDEEGKCIIYDDVTYGTGLNPSIGTLPNGEFLLFYYHNTTYKQVQVNDADGNPINVMDNAKMGNLMKATLTAMPDPASLASTPFIKNVLVGTPATLVTGDVGQYNSFFAFQTNGWYAVSFYNKTLNQLQFVFDFGSSLRLQTADDGWRENAQGNDYQIELGADCDIAVDTGGYVHIVYQDQSSSKLMFYQEQMCPTGACGDKTQKAVQGMVGGLDASGNAMEYGLSFGYFPKQYLIGGMSTLVSSYMIDVTNQKDRQMKLRLDMAAPGVK